MILINKKLVSPPFGYFTLSFRFPRIRRIELPGFHSLENGTPTLYLVFYPRVMDVMKSWLAVNYFMTPGLSHP